MKPLRHLDHDPDDEVRLAARLLAATAPRPRSQEARARVRAAIARRRRQPRLVLRPLAVVVLVLLCLVSVASARYGRAALRRVAGVFHSATVRSEHQRARGTEPPPAPKVVVSVMPPLPAAPVAPALGPEQRSPTATTPLRARARPSTRAASLATSDDGQPQPARVAPPAASDAMLVSDAFRRLRVDHDAVAAAALLDAYLLHHPDDPLAEDALALSIEAAVQLHDELAFALARQYLSRFPAGRYAALARSLADGHRSSGQGKSIR
jgi:hypothetical protein